MALPLRLTPAVEPDAAPPAPADPPAPAPAHYPMWMWRCAVVLPHPALPASGPRRAPSRLGAREGRPS